MSGILPSRGNRYEFVMDEELEKVLVSEPEFIPDSVRVHKVT